MIHEKYVHYGVCILRQYYSCILLAQLLFTPLSNHSIQPLSQYLARLPFALIGIISHSEDMKRLMLGDDGIEIPSIGLGCMRISEMSPTEAAGLIDAAVGSGINFFDHADIYEDGLSEEVFAAGLKEAGVKREDIILQSKCGIRDGQFDFSKEHILDSVDGILRRLNTEYLDILLLHRPDVLMEADEVADAFTVLREAGKVRHFGVSNQNPGQMELLRRSMPMPIVANQLQLSLAVTGMIDAGLNVNMTVDAANMRDGGVLEYCRLNRISIQAWSPFQFGFFGGVFLGNERYTELNTELQRQSLESNLSPTALSIAWLLRIPGAVQPLIGTTNPDRVRDIALAADYQMSRKDWYSLYCAAGNTLP